jgi:hypothetical protein
MRFLGNCLIEFASGDLALVEPYDAAFFRLGADAELARTMWVGGSGENRKYGCVRARPLVDGFKRRCGGWRISHRTNIYVAMPSQPVPDPSRDPIHHWSRRGRDDLLFVMQKEILGESCDPPATGR